MGNDYLPPNAVSQERSLSTTTARIDVIPSSVRSVWSPYTCPVGILPWLAWVLRVDNWDSTWSEAQKRNTIAASVAVHRVKGTLGALRRALEAIGHNVLVDERTGIAYTFRLRVDITSGTLPDSVYTEAQTIALAVKNLRSNLTGLDSFIGTVSTPFITAHSVDGADDTVMADVVTDEDASGGPFVGGTVLILMNAAPA